MNKTSSVTSSPGSFQKNICRTCLCKITALNSTPIFSDEDFLNGQSLKQVFVEITCTLIDPLEKLPSSMCQECVEKLKSAVNFKRSIEEADKKLRSKLRLAELSFYMGRTDSVDSMLDSFCDEIYSTIDKNQVQNATQRCENENNQNQVDNNTPVVITPNRNSIKIINRTNKDNAALTKNINILKKSSHLKTFSGKDFIEDFLHQQDTRHEPIADLSFELSNCQKVYSNKNKTTSRTSEEEEQGQYILIVQEVPDLIQDEFVTIAPQFIKQEIVEDQLPEVIEVPDSPKPSVPQTESDTTSDNISVNQEFQFSSDDKLAAEMAWIQDNLEDLGTLTGDNTIRCNKCEKRFTSLHNLQRHLLYHALDLEPDGKVDANKNHERNERIETERRINESRQTANNNNIPKPVLVSSMKEPRRVAITRCKYCRKDIETRSLVDHIDQEHKEEIMTTRHKEDIMTMPPIIRRREKEKKQKQIFSCSECSKTFTKKQSFLKHTKTHIPKFKCEHCDKMFFKKTILDVHLARVHNLRRISLCYICGKTVAESYLYLHLRTHTCKKSVRCPVKGCNSLLKYKTSIAVHMRRAHVTEKPFICEHCGKLFAVKDSLRLHLMSHKQDYRFFCTVCDKGFYVRSRLKKHFVSHQQNKRYQCPLCPQVFTFQSSIRKHCIRYHPEHPLAANPPPYLRKTYVPRNPAEKRFKCSICPRRFAYAHSVKIHNRRCHPFLL